MSEILLFSGGIDSYVAWHYLDKPQTVYFDIGSKYSEKEVEFVSALIPSTIIDRSLFLGDTEQEDSAYIPFRNLFFALLGAKYADTIIIAGLKDDMVSDKNEDIFKEFSMLMTTLESRKLKVVSPFWHLTKSQVVKWFMDNVDWSGHMLLNTISCYSGEVYCGKCPACFRKWCALKDNNIDGLDYFYNNNLLEEYYNAAVAGKYVKERNETILKVVGEYYYGKGRNL